MAQGFGFLQDGGIFPLSTMYLPRESGDIDVGIPERVAPEILEAAMEDDVVGSGIFGDGNNVNSRDGVFADRMSLPGYLAREPGTGPSEVVDGQIGTQILSLADGWRSGGYVGDWTTAPMPHFQNGVNAPDMLTLADSVDFAPAPIPMANNWAAQVATPNRPAQDPNLPRPNMVNNGIFGAPGTQGTSASATPLLPPGAGVTAPIDAARLKKMERDVMAFPTPPPAYTPRSPFEDLSPFMTSSPGSRAPQPVWQPTQPTGMRGLGGPRGGVFMAPNGTRLADPATAHAAMNRGTVMQAMYGGGQRGGAVSYVSAATAGGYRSPASPYAQAQMQRTNSNPNPNPYTPQFERRGAGGLGSLSAFGELVMPSFASGLGSVVAYGLLGGVAIGLLALALDVDVVEEVKSAFR